MCACTLVQYTAAPGTVSAAAASKASAIMGAVVGVLISGVYVLVARVTPNIKWSILASVVRVGLDMDPSSTDPRLHTVVNLVEEWPASTVHALGLISSLCFITSMCWSALLGSVASRWTRSWLRWGAIVLVLQYASLSAKGVPVAMLEGTHSHCGSCWQTRQGRPPATRVSTAWRDAGRDANPEVIGS